MGSRPRLIAARPRTAGPPSRRSWPASRNTRAGKAERMTWPDHHPSRSLDSARWSLVAGDVRAERHAPSPWGATA